MAAELPESEPPGAALDRLAGQITQLEELAASWDEQHLSTLTAIKSAIEELNREAFRRLIRSLREDPASARRLSEAVRDPFLFGVLRFHGLVKDPLEHRVERALEEVRPALRTHGGDVEIVAVRMPDTVEIRLLGACHGCPASSQTLSEGVELAIRRHCPEVRHIRQVGTASARAGSDGQVVRFTSPFAGQRDPGWEEVCALVEIPDGGILTRTLGGREILLYRRGGAVSCFENACAHMGMPLDGGEVRDGRLECPYHSFSYLLETGECLTVPEVQLKSYPVRVSDARVRVRAQG